MRVGVGVGPDGAGALELVGWPGRVFRQNQYVSNASNNATTSRPEITSATTVPVLSLFAVSSGALDDASLPPGTRSGPPLGAVSPGATGTVVLVVDVVVVVVFFVCAPAVDIEAGKTSVVRTNRAAINVRRAPTRSVKG